MRGRHVYKTCLLGDVADDNPLRIDAGGCEAYAVCVEYSSRTQVARVLERQHIAGHGPDAVVLDPTELADAVRARFAAAVAAHSTVVTGATT